MRVIVAGSRTLSSPGLVGAAIEASGFRVTELVSGGARGADRLAEEWAAGHNIPCTRFPAEWPVYGRGAGPRRNQRMAEYAEALVAVWDGRSRGTRDMIEEARRRGLKVYVHRAG